ncbi:3'-5' exonuclease [Chloropicon primus]|uniref:3'-5' exonuclease n=2 Tax=Chloropicon primus TaxID=1764295 RepID=A0A5B8ME80_9CHLO|nr:3'-5' exonuclease [Chloropicon primus]UPQ98114.1 3'-5' exonuclease [Chloropicon primus]|eukprot:QDZ18906.1 3'-5' exonuclease [Chloropicon primus]
MASRPQDSWTVKPDNSKAAFVHRPCGLDPPSSSSSASASSALLLERAQKLGYAKGAASESHPLGNVIRGMAFEDWMLECDQAQSFKSFKATPLTYVDDKALLEVLAKKLDEESVIAVDLENHSLHSYQGFLCLMQVSTRREDFIVDCLALRNEVGPALGHIFADPKKVKVIHGANSDIVWLQRDHGIYVSNLFDTGQAARALNLPKFGLAFLLQHYCNYNTDKRHQMADWRMRPLPDYLVTYARADTHFLLYIYDRLKIDLRTRKLVPEEAEDAELPQSYPQNLTGLVLWKSAVISMQMYDKPVFTETTYLDYYAKQRVSYNSKQLAVFAGLFAWRDAKARELDESPEAVLSRSQLLDLSRGPKSSSWQRPFEERASRDFLGRICSRKSTNFAASRQEDLFQVISSSIEQNISYGSSSVDETTKTKTKTKTKTNKKSQGPKDEGTGPRPEVVARLSKGSAVWDALDQGKRSVPKCGKVESVVMSLKLPFLRAKKAPAAAGSKKSEEERPQEGGRDPARPAVSANDIRSWANKTKEEEEKVQEPKTEGKEAFPKPLSKRYQMGKSRQQRPAQLDKASAASGGNSSGFDYSAAREQLKNRKKGKRRQNMVAQSFYSIPDENLVKPAKRRKQPQTGNRSMTFK